MPRRGLHRAENGVLGAGLQSGIAGFETTVSMNSLGSERASPDGGARSGETRAEVRERGAAPDNAGCWLEQASPMAVVMPWQWALSLWMGLGDQSSINQRKADGASIGG